MLKEYWETLPIGKENAATYAKLCEEWSMSERKARSILHALSLYDSGDNYILIRSSSGKGFFRTDDLETIKAYKKECTKKAKSNFAPLKKINRILAGAEDIQFNFFNNMTQARELKGMTQQEAVDLMQRHDKTVNTALLSKFENSVCLPTPYQVLLFARIYDVKPFELIDYESYLL
jgi:hypothetical protein